MAVNYAGNYEKAALELIREKALSTPGVNEDFIFTGGKTVAINSVRTSAMNNYAATGVNRYGTPAELPGDLDEVTLSKDRAFTFTIDKRRYENAEEALNAGAALNRQIVEVVVPEIDKRRFEVMADMADFTVSEAVSASNAYNVFMAANEALSDEEVPFDGRVAFVTPKYLKWLKQDAAFNNSGVVGDDLKFTGVVGRLDGCLVVLTPSSYMPDGTDFIIAHQSAVVAPVTVAEYKVHDNPPGINGWLVEGRVCFDAFVPSFKTSAIYRHTA